MKISIIIPVYNADKYLRKCLDSVLLALDGISGEVLLIDNNSIDNSLKIAKEYAKKYPKIVRVLQCHTPGAAAVRNDGASKSRGEYIWFIDADDYIADNAISKLLEKADITGADMVMMGAKRIARDGSTSYLSAIEANKPDTKSKFVRYGMGPWQILIRRGWWNYVKE